VPFLTPTRSTRHILYRASTSAWTIGLSCYPLNNHCVIRKYLLAVIILTGHLTAVHFPRINLPCTISLRKSCLRTSSYSISPAFPPSQPPTPPSGDIIHVAAKGKGGRRRIKNVFADTSEVASCPILPLKCANLYCKYIFKGLPM